jgi:hypothetical protein
MTNPHPPYSGHGNLDKAGQRAASGVTEAEAPYLEKLGTTINTLRLQAGLTLREAGELGELHHLSWMHLEAGTRRTRAETLARIAKVLAPRVGFDATVLHLYLVKLAGPALGDEKARTWHLHGGIHG